MSMNIRDIEKILVEKASYVDDSGGFPIVFCRFLDDILNVEFDASFSFDNRKIIVDINSVIIYGVKDEYKDKINFVIYYLLKIFKDRILSLEIKDDGVIIVNM